MDKKTLRNDLILFVSLLLVVVVSTVVVLLTRKVATKAKIIVQDNVVEVVDLSKIEDQDFYVKGLNGTLHIHTHEGAIAVLESNCPHQDCVNMGYVKESGHPIICSYNAVTIVIDGEGADAEIG